MMSRDEILDRLRERIVAYAASRLQGDAAQDLAQEVLIVVHEKYGHLERLEDLVPLSFEILRFKMGKTPTKSKKPWGHVLWQIPIST